MTMHENKTYGTFLNIPSWSCSYYRWHYASCLCVRPSVCLSVSLLCRCKRYRDQR